MKCASCGEIFPRPKKSSARYCGDACRGEAANNRKRLRKKKARRLAAKSAVEVPTNDSAEAPTRRAPGRSVRSAGQIVFHDLQALVRETTERIIAASQTRGSSSRNLHSVPARIDMKEQILRQAPAGASGYRLVLPTAKEGVRPSLAPRRKKCESRAYYGLSPFEYPLDVRLHDGRWYRLLWTDTEGQSVAPAAELGVPSLYFFLGASDAQASISNAHLAGTPSLPDGSAQDSSVKLLATQAEDADNAHPSVQIEEAEAIAPLKLATPTEAHDAKPSVESDGAPALAEPQADEPQAGVQGSALVAASECSDAQIATSEAARRGVYSVKPQSKATALHTFWTAEGKYALQLESLAQLLYEQRFAKAKEEGLPIPEEPMTQLPRDQRKAIRRLASHPALMQVGRFLQRRFDSARQEGIGAFESLPLDPATLSESDQRLLQSVRSNAQRRIFLDYLHARGNALLIGDSIPTEPVTSLSSTERKRLFKMISDVRSIAELMTIND